jgi:REP element-mobilizing transposase RayT
MSSTLRKRIRLSPSVYREFGRIFSVTVGTDPRSPIFADLDYGLACVEHLRDLSVSRSNQIFAYCLMPDHAHLLVDTREISPLPDFVGAWKSLCYLERRRRGRPERFWQRSFFDHALRFEEDVRKAAMYILHNPVRKGLVSEYSAYELAGSLVFSL